MVEADNKLTEREKWIAQFGARLAGMRLELDSTKMHAMDYLIPAEKIKILGENPKETLEALIKIFGVVSRIKLTPMYDMEHRKTYNIRLYRI